MTNNIASPNFQKALRKVQRDYPMGRISRTEWQQKMGRFQAVGR